MATKTAQKIKHTKRDKLRFNMMVVGESGVGKTTFLNALLRRYHDNISIASPEVAITDKTIQIQKVGEFEVSSETGDKMDINLYDSPGYGDFVNNQEAIDKVRKYIFECHSKWRSLDAQSMTEAEFLQKDERIHCVFYFIASHRLKDIDNEFIATISPIVPIIPVIGKADTMTVKERNRFVTLVKEVLDAISTKFGDPCIYDFHGDDLIDDSIDKSLIRQPNIFAVTCDLSNERVYPWGTIKIDDHSDFRRLQKVIFENERHLKGLMDIARNKTIKLFRKPPPPAPTPVAGPPPTVPSSTEEKAPNDEMAKMSMDNDWTKEAGSNSAAGATNGSSIEKSTGSSNTVTPSKTTNSTLPPKQPATYSPPPNTSSNAANSTTPGSTANSTTPTSAPMLQNSSKTTSSYSSGNDTSTQGKTAKGAEGGRSSLFGKLTGKLK